MRSLISRSKGFWLTYLPLLVICCILQLVYGSEDLTFAINGLHSSILDPAASLFTWLGDGNITLFISLLLFFFSLGKALSFLIITNLAGFLAQIIKHRFFATAVRPALYFQAHHLQLHFVEGVKIYYQQSFPSGHTTTAFSVALLLSLYTGKKPLQGLLALAACLVGWSRMYLGEHFFGDVLAGSALGSISSIIFMAGLSRTRILQKPWFDLSLIGLYRRSRRF